MRKLIPVILLALVAASCSSSDGSAVEATDATDDPGAVESAALDTSPAMDDPILDAITVQPPITEDGDPVVTIDGELSTDTTVRRVLTEGDGEVAEPGSTVTIQVMLLNGRTGERFDGTRPGEPATVSLDPASVLVGIFRSLVGVPAGSQVVSAVSPDEGVGAQGGFPDLGVEADDTIVFVFDVVAVTVPLERAIGTAVEPPAGLPTVILAEDGTPSISLPEGDPPAELIGQVLIEGDGAVVEEGQSLTVHYTGIIWPGGEQFDSSWDRGEPAAFTIAAGSVIPGWVETLVGQTVGSQLVLVIPPEQGYGVEGNPTAGILGTDTLVFVVDILGAT